MNGYDGKKNNKSKWDNTGLFLLQRVGTDTITSTTTTGIPSREKDKNKTVQKANIVFWLFSLKPDFPSKRVTF